MESNIRTAPEWQANSCVLSPRYERNIGRLGASLAAVVGRGVVVDFACPVKMRKGSRTGLGYTHLDGDSFKTIRPTDLADFDWVVVSTAADKGNDLAVELSWLNNGPAVVLVSEAAPAGFNGPSVALSDVISALEVDRV